MHIYHFWCVAFSIVLWITILMVQCSTYMQLSLIFHCHIDHERLLILLSLEDVCKRTIFALMQTPGLFKRVSPVPVSPSLSPSSTSSSEFYTSVLSKTSRKAFAVSDLYSDCTGEWFLSEACGNLQHF